MNIKLRLADEEELEDGSARGPTLEFVLEKEEMFLQEEEEEELCEQQQQQQQPAQQLCSKAAEKDRTDPCSADSCQTTNFNSKPDANP